SARCSAPRSRRLATLKAAPPSRSPSGPPREEDARSCLILRKMRGHKRLPVFGQPLFAVLQRSWLADHTPASGQCAPLRPQTVLTVVILQNSELPLWIVEGITEFHTKLLSREIA